MTKLYIVEGLPCSGKSTTARFIANTLETMGRRVYNIDEGTGDHPADYEFHALLDGQIISLNQFPPEELSALLPYKIYDGGSPAGRLPWDIEAPLMLDKWRQFVRETDAETTYVFNSVLLQNPMCETMMRFNLPESASAAHIRAIANIIAPLSPTVVYLHNDDIAHRILQTAAERPGWLESMIDYHVSGGYGRFIGATGFDGYIACLTERQRREERILQTLPVRTVTLDNPHRDWAAAHAQLHTLLAGGAS